MMKQPLKVGDTVKVSGHDREFTQTVDSIQVEHKQVSQLGAGEEGAVKVNESVKEGDVLYLVTKK